jgi:hypothetical protein
VATGEFRMGCHEILYQSTLLHAVEIPQTLLKLNNKDEQYTKDIHLQMFVCPIHVFCKSYGS